MLIARHVAIIGGGFSGTLLAINLLRHGSQRVTLVERRSDRLGRGLAYGAAHADHLLNVRAANMSAFPDQPDHFATWLRNRGMGADTSFATRRVYGDYLCALLEDMQRAAPGRFSVIADEAVDLTLHADGARVTLASGRFIDADVATIAPGNLPPHRLAAFATVDSDAYVNDPWSRDLAAGLSRRDRVMLLGTGLTAVDSILSLVNAGFAGSILALSRRGLAPHAHAPADAFTPTREKPSGPLSTLLHQVRDRAVQVGWRNAVDELRPFTQNMWRAASHAQRERFLRHLRPYWDVHRHRIAPPVAARLDALRAEGRLSILAAKVLDATPTNNALAVTIRRRGANQGESMQAARVVNCTGPLGDLRRAGDPLLRALADRGDIRADALAIGIDVDQQGRALAQHGSAQDRLLVVGPMTRGAHWEIVAVPDIRRQVWTLARQITGAHWVEAEGL
ncbi:FAD/NAD(P)-binding protein [Sphingobium rhizovicinum]|uniref:FAD/NAD(P)-binding protein n=1 Tax=Sphingobium rhizovicinum TaxID=432308 RepID=A0ABV7NJL1_9SPHN